MTEPTITVRKEWLTIAGFAGAVVAAEIAGILLDDPREKIRIFEIAANLIGWLGHAVWLSMDRARRGLDTGSGWRYAVIFLGPLAIWFYLILEYRARALYLIPLSLGIYLILGIAMAGAMIMARGV
jgi:hypothetical protein